MAIDPRLAAKLDQALATIRPNRAANGGCATAFVADLKKRCQTRLPFRITLDGTPHDIAPASVRVSRTCIELGPVRIRLGGVQRDWIETEDDTPPAIFYTFYTSDQDDDLEAWPRKLVFVDAAPVAAAA